MSATQCEVCQSLHPYLLENYSVELSPATNHSFTVGYMSDGRTKCDIKTDKQLEEASLSAKNGSITLWVDPHSTFIKKDEKERREGRGQAKRRKTSGLKPIRAMFAIPKLQKQNF